MQSMSVAEIRGGSARLNLTTIRELFAYREVLWAFLERAVRVKYKQAAVGVGWAVLQPLLSAVVFSVVLGRFANVPSDGKPYLLFVLCGMVAWSYFATATANGMESVVRDSTLVRKVYFPREVLPLAYVGAALVDLLPGLAVLGVVATLYGFTPGIEWVALPVVILLLAAIAVACSLLPAALNVYYRDVRMALPFFIQIGLFASAVVWPLSRIRSDTGRVTWEIVNPVVAAIDSTRRIVTEGRWPEFTIVGAALAWSLGLVLVSYWGFKRLERNFADRV